MLGVGIWILVDDDFEQYTKGVDEFTLIITAAYIAIVIGIIIMVIGFLGCCGAIRVSQVMLALVRLKELFFKGLNIICHKQLQMIT